VILAIVLLPSASLMGTGGARESPIQSPDLAGGQSIAEGPCRSWRPIRADGPFRRRHDPPGSGA
jgi:hypothetical protein